MTHASCPSDVGLFGIHFFGLGYVQSVCASVAKLGNTENRALGAVYYLKGTPGFPGSHFVILNILERRGLQGSAGSIQKYRKQTTVTKLY